jgi:phosphoribosyl-dephospho-CoA transferase
MTPQSAKAKGRKLQQYVRDAILRVYVGLTLRDVVSTSMGAGGADIKLSEAAFKNFPYAVECKANAKNATVTLFKQAQEHAKATGGEPVLIIKVDREKPVAVVDFEHFLELTTRIGVQTHG